VYFPVGCIHFEVTPFRLIMLDVDNSCAISSRTGKQDIDVMQYFLAPEGWLNKPYLGIDDD
jgi:hypothetical protein